MIFLKKIFLTLWEMSISYIGASQVVLVVKNPPANAGDEGSIPESGRPLEDGMRFLAWRSPMDRGA